MCANNTHDADVFPKSELHVHVHTCTCIHVPAFLTPSVKRLLSMHLLSLALQRLHPRVLLLRRFAVDNDALLAVSVEQLDAVLYLNTECFV